MLINFGVKNFASFKDHMGISMLAYNRLKTHLNSLIKNRNFTLLKSIVLYGANASGKSNILQALFSVSRFLLHASSVKPGTVFNAYFPFLLSTETENKPTEYFFDFYIKNLKRVFHYEIKILDTKIVYESLVDISSKQETSLFERREDNKITIDQDNFQEGKTIKQLKIINDHVPLVSLSSYLNGKISKEITSFFRSIYSESFTMGSPYITEHDRIIKDNDYKKNVEDKLRYADLGITGLDFYQDKRFVSQNVNNNVALPDFYSFKFRHKKFDENKTVVGEVSLDNDAESMGTHSFFSLMRLAEDIIYEGGVMIVDEIERSLHPLLALKIIEMFNTSKNNHAQLIFSTHNTNFLNSEIFRKDQVWFVEKDKYGASSLYSLLDFNTKARADLDWERRYLAGLYGAVPLLKKNIFYE